MSSRLFITNNLLSELKKTPGYSEDNILIEYIKDFDSIIGMDQLFTVNMAKRLGFDLGLDRYINNVNITLREVLYYELLNYIKYYENNRRDKKLPTTNKLINIQEKDFKVLYKRLHKEKPYYKSFYTTRLSVMTDYIMYGVKKNKE